MASEADRVSESSSPTAGGRRADLLPVVAWSSIAAVLLLLQFFARYRSRGTIRPLDGWVQFDGPEYLSIATRGYTPRQLVWFPTYPTVLGWVDRVVADPVLAGVVVSATCGLAATVLFWRWTRTMDVPERSRRVALLVLLLYPYGWFLYGVVYSDALFLAFALLAFLSVERGRVWLAAAAGAVATATRPSGLAVTIGLCVLSLERAGVLYVPGPEAGWAHRLRLPVCVDLRLLRWRHVVPGLSVLGLVGYMTYLWVRWDNPIRFVSEQSRYHDSGSGTLLKQQYFDAWYSGADGRHLATTTAQAVLLMVVLGSVAAVGRRYGWGYGAFVFCLALLPMVSVSTFMGSGRYLLPAFPCFVLAGEWLASRRAAQIAWFTLSGAALLVMAFGFSRSWYLT